MAIATRNTPNSKKPVWFITGCSTGFGRQIATHVLELGYPTVVTSRDPDDISDLAELGDALVLELDVTDRTQAEAAVQAAEDHFGRIDVLVNNAGIGYFAAVEGLSEALWQEVEPLGIKVMLVEPSGFRTDWAGRSANETEYPIADYADTAEKNILQLRADSGNQAGDPVRAAEAIVQAVESPNPPHRLLLGNDATTAQLRSWMNCVPSSMSGRQFRVEPTSRKHTSNRPSL
jgi:NAD(P)-dependent dehydrogenase (short-subunit alcohol dehydrogenase family)